VDDETSSNSNRGYCSGACDRVQRVHCEPWRHRIPSWRRRTAMVSSESTYSITTPIQFSEENAYNYFQSLNTSTGLLSDYRGDHTIYLSDDQALDYNALMDIFNSTGNSNALRLANQINTTMSENFGSLYGIWNEVFVLFGQFPSKTTWNVTGGVNQNYGTDNGYQMLSTVFPKDNDTTVELGEYADIALYYAIWNAKVAGLGGSGGTLIEANQTFAGIQSDCTDYGCTDDANVGQASAFQSYKVALDLISYRLLFDAGAFNDASSSEMVQIDQIINRLAYVANQLQAPDGGVYTQYNIVSGRVVPVGPGVTSAENGETTSLFVILSNIWTTT
jgi:hypothetical protein